MGEQRRDGKKDPEDRVRDHERRNEGAQLDYLREQNESLQKILKEVE
jgi:hypothetical protein